MLDGHVRELTTSIGKKTPPDAAKNKRQGHKGGKCEDIGTWQGYEHDVERTCPLTDHIAYLAVHSRAVASCCTVLFFKICGKTMISLEALAGECVWVSYNNAGGHTWAISGTKGSSGLGSVRSEHIDNNTYITRRRRRKHNVRHHATMPPTLRKHFLSNPVQNPKHTHAPSRSSMLVTIGLSKYPNRFHRWNWCCNGKFSLWNWL